MSVLLCDNISKNISNGNSIQNFTFNFLDKKIYGIIGKSDSGIDTLLDMFTMKTRPSSGTIWVDGKDLKENKNLLNRVCYINKKTYFPDSFSVKMICMKMALNYTKWDNYYAYTLCRHFNIKMDSLFCKMSKAKRHLFLGICSLASRANITIYNDIVSDVDLKDRHDFYSFMYEHFTRYPRTIIMATDYIDEIDYMFDKVLFMDKGRLIDYFTTKELKNNFRYLTGKTEVLKSLISGIKIIGAEERGGILTVCIRKRLTKDDTRKFQKYLIEISDVPIQKVFIYLITLREIKNKKYDAI